MPWVLSSDRGLGIWLRWPWSRKWRAEVNHPFPSESSGPRPLCGGLIAASRGWHGLERTPNIWRELKLLRKEAFGEQGLIIAKEAAIA